MKHFSLRVLSYPFWAAILLVSAPGLTPESAAADGPCDIYKAGGTPCVAAHSTVRALFAAFGGALYQVRRASDSKTQDIAALSPGGQADAASQDAFCKGTTCVITKIYDQTTNGNFMEYQGSGSSVGGVANPAVATAESLFVGGKKVYSLYIKQGMSYWRNGSKSGMPLGSDPEAMYFVVNGKHFVNTCCFDYGNSETDRKPDGAGTMDALNFSSIKQWGTGAPPGPWIMADLEFGLFSHGGGGVSQADPTQTNTYVTGWLKNNGKTEFAIKGGDATTGGLGTYYKGALPPGYNPMRKQGAIVLGSGGDCCPTNFNLAEGTFYEGAIVSGYPTDSTENAIQANIIAAGYGSKTVGISDQAPGESAAFSYDRSHSRLVFRYALGKAGVVALDVVDPAGRRAAAIVAGPVSAGGHEAVWNAGNLTPGVYIARLSVDGRKAWTAKFVLGE